MARRLLDVALAAAALVLAAPVLALAALGIVLSDGRPVVFRARRVGTGGRAFLMYKLRTMRRSSGGGSRITAADDPRIFALGRLLRRAKIDELPQLVNVLKGDMAIVGPRPEDAAFVKRHYAPEHLETLTVRPGLVSPGSLYNTTHGDPLLAGGDPERRYLVCLLPLKLALDQVYVRHASFRTDLAIIARTIGVILMILCGRRWFPQPPEMAEARLLLVPARDDETEEARTPSRPQRPTVERGGMMRESA